MFEKDLREMCEITVTKIARIKEQAVAMEKYLESGGKITHIPIGVTAVTLGNDTSFRQKELNRARARNGGKAPRAINKTKLEDL